MTPDKASDTEGLQADYELCIMRHGAAAARGEAAYFDDAKRPLTAAGKEKMHEIAAGLKKAGFEADWIVSSPLVRAEETAKIVATALTPHTPMETSETLSPGAAPEALLAFLAKHRDRRHILVVGHEPDLSHLAARLIGSGRNANLAFKKGGCCLISFREFPPKAPGQLVWWLTPRILRKLT
jgi:phosphohistidine phosphatase